ncbi:MAG: hypothetical protein AAF441_18925 [Pseudomonadota bacterium]
MVSDHQNNARARSEVVQRLKFRSLFAAVLVFPWMMFALYGPTTASIDKAFADQSPEALACAVHFVERNQKSFCPFIHDGSGWSVTGACKSPEEFGFLLKSSAMKYCAQRPLIRK